jgi:2-isopropylmalate synthase
MFSAVKELADKKEQIYDEDVEAMVLEKVYRRKERFRLKDMSVLSGTGDVPPHAAVIMEFGEEDGEVEDRRTTQFGHGTIDAVFTSIYELVGFHATLESYTVNAVTSGTDALAGVAVRISHDGVKAVGRSNDEDVVRASAMALVNALNRLEIMREEKK